LLVPSRVPSGRAELRVQMYRQACIGGPAEYVFPLTISNPEYGKPLDDPAYTLLRSRHQGKDIKFASLRRAAAPVELAPAFPGETVIGTAAADAAIFPSNRDWDPRKNNFGTEKFNQFGWPPHNHAAVPLLLKFDLAGVGPGTPIIGAALRLTVVDSWGPAPLDFEVYAVRRAWTENGACYYGPEGGNGPAWGAEGCADPAADIIPGPATTLHTEPFVKDKERRRLVTIDLTGLVEQWQSGKVPNNGIIIRPAAAFAKDHDLRVCAHEFEDYPFRPTLVIAYEGADPVSRVKGPAPAFPGAEAAVKTAAPAPKAEPPAPPRERKSADLPAGFCWLVTQNGDKFPAKILQYDGDRFRYQKTDGSINWGARSEFAIICP
jgi:hypothetical protein